MPEITDEMVERAGRALCDHENAIDRRRSEALGGTYVGLRYEDWRQDFDNEARVVLTAAFQQVQPSKGET